MRFAHTLVELLVVCAVVGIMAALAAPRIHAAADSMAVESAAREVTDALAVGRLAALRHGGADVQFDSVSVAVQAGGMTVLFRDVARLHGVRLHANTAVVRYAATGLASGLSNGTVVLSRGARVDTVVISRLGRVRR